MADVTKDFYTFYEKNNFERSRRFSPGSYSIEPLKSALGALGNPENTFKIFHVGGTVAKGSISHLLAGYFRQRGENVGLYTSPHLLRLNERIAINGEEISDEDFGQCFNTLKENCAARELSFFDALTTIAFLYFRDKKISTAIIEVGLGGRLDSTNVVKPAAVFFGPVGMDHRNVLGNTLQEIAAEKAGIIKPGCKVFSMRQKKEVAVIFKQAAEAVGAQLFFPEYPELVDYRKENHAFVAAALNIWENHPVELPHLNLTGRFEKLHANPDIFFDSAHNAPGMQALARLLLKEYPQQSTTIYFTCMRERNPRELLEVFISQNTTEIIFPEIPVTACHKPAELQLAIQNRGKIVSLTELQQYLRRKDRIHVFCGTMQLYEPVVRILKSSASW